ncbi:MAG TPA: SCO family protein [Candidatus Binatia bacterium]|nr:SCO family protein [Candidatus Binatia bacterium]
MLPILASAVILHGTVLGVDERNHVATIHHDAFAGMPAMTMTFDIDRRGLQPAPGDRVTGVVDETSEPWTLRVTAERTAPSRAEFAPFVPQLRAGSIVPDANFVDQRGRALSWRSFRGRVVVVSFIYTRCRDAQMCPLVSAKFAAMQRLIPPGARMIEFTLDPDYDTPAVLARYGALFGAADPPWTLATGTASALRRIALEFGIGISRIGRNAIVHTEAVAIVNPDGTVRIIVPGNSWRPEEVVADVGDASGLASNWWQRFVLQLRSGAGRAARACGAIDENGHVRAGLLLTDVAALVVILFACAMLVRLLVELRSRTRREP